MMKAISYHRRYTKTQLIAVIIAVLSICLASVAFDNQTTQGSHILVPYFSGAANFKLGRGWVHNEADTRRYDELLFREAKEAYRFQPSADVKPFAYLQEGYVYIALIARSIFFWKGDIKAVESFQILVHLIITLFIISRIPRQLSKLLFFVLYGINPLILYFVTFPYYYFWQVIPTSIIVAYLMDREFKIGHFTPVVAILLVFVHVIRPTMLLCSIGLLILVSVRESKWRGGLSCALLLSGVFLFSGGEPPWHTMYIGVGAYPNPYVEGPNDRYGYEQFERQTGEAVKVGIGGNFYVKEGIRRKYDQAMKEAYLEILGETPWLLIRNGLLNFFQAFSLGYFVDSIVLSYMSSLFGLLYCILLLIRKKYLFVVFISLSAFTYVPYFPPIQAYMYGSYILLVAAFIELVEDVPLYQRWSDRVGLTESRVIGV